MVAGSLLVKDCVAYRRCIRRFCKYVYFSKLKAPGVKFLEGKNFFYRQSLVYTCYSDRNVNKNEKWSKFGHASELHVKFNFLMTAKSDQDPDPHIFRPSRFGPRSGSALKPIRIDNKAIFLFS